MFFIKPLVIIVPWMRKLRHFVDTFLQAIFGSVNPEAAALYRVKYRQHNERVQAIIPAEKLLVFNVKNGWKPLCDFLGCDVPSTPFPRENVAHSDAKKGISQFIGDTKRYIALVILSTIVLIFCCCFSFSYYRFIEYSSIEITDNARLLFETK